MMKRLDEQIGELKRVFVTEYARRTGTGKALIEARETAARVFETADSFNRIEPILRSHMDYFSKEH